MENPCRYYRLHDHSRLEFHTNARPVRLCIRVAQSPEDVDAWIKALRPTVLGLDIEWKPVFSKAYKENRASLLQLSCNDDVLLVQLFQVPVPPALQEVLADERVKKVGVGIVGDALKMQRDWGIEVNGLVSLGQGRSLAKVAYAATDIKLSKKKNICLSNWENQTLSSAQIIYAALDAWVASESFAVLSATQPPQKRADVRAPVAVC